MYWKNLRVWKKAHNLVKEIYRFTVNFPKEELYGLANQIKRASVSVPTNIVEGYARDTTKDYIHFLFNSRGSLEELRYLLLLAKELNFGSKEKYITLEKSCEETSKMLNGLIKRLRSKL